MIKNAFLIACSFLTRFPITYPINSSQLEQQYSIAFFPVVGLMLGGMLWGLSYCLSNTSSLLASAIIITVWILMSGALHLDGLSDCVDAWIGGFLDKEKTLQIIKDPHIGVISSVILIITIVLKLITLNELIDHLNSNTLLIIPVLGRCTSIALFMTTDYINHTGLGKSYVNQCSTQSEKKNNIYRKLALILSFLLVLLMLRWNGVMLLSTLTLLFYMIRRMAISRLGGFNGDVAGAMIEITEVTSCLVLAIIL